MARTLDYMGVSLDRLTIRELLDIVRAHVVDGKSLTYSNFGFPTVNIVSSHPAALDTFRALDILTPEGISILCTSRLFGPPLKIANRICGDVLCPYLYDEALRQGWGIYLLGSAPGVASAVASKLRQVYPSLLITGTHHGYLTSEAENEAVISEINDSGTTVLLVGMGQPKQEEWIVTNKEKIKPAFLVAVGGYFDHMLRRIDSYPTWVYKFRLNWAYRLFKEPRRLWRRYTIGLLTFGWRVLAAKLAGPHKTGPAPLSLPLVIGLLVVGIMATTGAAAVARTCAEPIDISGSAVLPGPLAGLKDRDEIAYPAHSTLGTILQEFGCEPPAIGLQWLKAAAHARSSAEVERAVGGLSAALRASPAPAELERQLCLYVATGFARRQQAAAAAAAGLRCAASPIGAP